MAIAAASICITPQLTNAASAATAKDNCIVQVTGYDAEGNFITSAPTCYTTFAEVLRSQGARNVATDATPSTTTSSVLAASSIIGTHYDGSGFSGSSFSVSGSNCSGGGLNVSTTWNDRISSTLSGLCTTITHYEDTNYAGSTFTTTGSGGNVTGYMDNKTSSIKYFA